MAAVGLAPWFVDVELSDERWAAERAAAIVLNAFAAYKGVDSGSGAVAAALTVPEASREASVPDAGVAASAQHEDEAELADATTPPHSAPTGAEAELSALSAQLATAEKQALELKREDAERAKRLVELTAQHESELGRLQEQLQTAKRQLDDALAKATQQPAPESATATRGAKKPSKICTVQ